MMIVTKRKRGREQDLILDVPKNNFRNFFFFFFVMRRTLAFTSTELSLISFTDGVQGLLRKRNYSILILLVIPKQSCPKSNC